MRAWSFWDGTLTHARAELHKSRAFELFEPAYPDEDSLLEIVNSNELRQRKRLRNAFGLPGYS